MSTSAGFHSATIPQERLLPGIHGLRGIAALAVVLFHVVHLANLSVPPAFSFIASDFGKGVHLFFVLSAFSLMHSTEHTLHRPTWMKEYFIKRFFRIAPLFYCLVAGMVLWPSVKAQYLAVPWQSILLNLTFTFGFAPWTGIVWAGWTVGVEMMFYAILPVLLLTVRTSRGTLILLVASLLVTLSSRSVLQTHFEHTTALYRYNWAYFSFAPNLCYFALGMYAFRVARETADGTRLMRLGTTALAALLLPALLAASVCNAWRPDLILWGFAFAALTLWQSKWPSRWCANRIFEHVGERSYSVYLLHPVVIVLMKQPLQSLYAALSPHMGQYAYFACAAAALLPLMLLSEATYRLIEIPSIRYGQRLNARFRARQEAAT
jgi:peptidoglycan/LPS O-acetylase OafA/YrhL